MSLMLSLDYADVFLKIENRIANLYSIFFSYTYDYAELYLQLKYACYFFL